MGIDGNLYFSNALQKDSRKDYCCFASFTEIRTIVQKTAMAVEVKRCKLTLQNKLLNFNWYMAHAFFSQMQLTSLLSHKWQNIFPGIYCSI